MKTINIIGCGKVGKTLAYLWNQQATLQIGGVLNSTLESTKNAVTFIQSGNAIKQLTELPPADIFMLGCGDNHIEHCCNHLVDSGVLQAGNIIFHCSGALSSELLRKAHDIGALIASVHPVKSFAEPALSIDSFVGTFCGVEGDSNALAVLKPIFEQIGAQTFALEASSKTLYHTASVIACNYMVALQEVSLHSFEQAGVDRTLALKILEPIVKGTADNIFQLGTTHALTGPIARGDHTIVARQVDALEAWNKNYAILYRQLGLVASELSHQQGHASAENLEIIKDKLSY